IPVGVTQIRIKTEDFSGGLNHNPLALPVYFDNIQWSQVNGVSASTNTFSVSDPAVIATGGFGFSAVEGTPSGSQTVATFTDPGGAEALSDYSANINWGDGTTSPGTISAPSGGVFTVSGSHTYAGDTINGESEGTATITVTIN